MGKYFQVVLQVKSGDCKATRFADSDLVTWLPSTIWLTVDGPYRSASVHAMSMTLFSMYVPMVFSSAITICVPSLMFNSGR